MQPAPKAALGAHMPVSKVLSSAVLAFVLSGSGLLAQGAGGTPMPAEFPPASYKGKQYVDSLGCVYIRAGVDGNVTWVPRVTRARQPICGAQPTFAAAKPAPSEPAKVAATPQPAPAPKPAQPAKATAPAPKPVKVVSVPVQPKKAAVTQPVMAKQPAPAMRKAAIQQHAPVRAGNCSPHMTGNGLRCGPQNEYPVTYGYGNGPVQPGTVVKPGSVPPGTRVAPKHVYHQQKNATAGVSVPKGYRPVWTDDRLNPKRAHQTFEGKAAMDQVWTQTVPRRLIDMAPVAKAPQPKAVSGRYVQVGMFGVPSNAQRTSSRLQQAGYPVRMANAAKGGRSYQIVLAGPFGSSQKLAAALNAVRNAGFRDAFIR